MEQIFEALECLRRAAIEQGHIVRWNCIPTYIPREAMPKVQLNNLGSAAFDPWVVQPRPQQQTCRLCVRHPACVAVLGCGHLCLCFGCAAHVRSGILQRCLKCNGSFLDDSGKLMMQLIS